ncbi:hypothetical protein BaRGS_00029056 [Batillaria attramentaria]|uniref:Uncharacterized protein n=1 Tax=Batillaria attramentaria TaxID=370345 RepID=A0ABD0JYL8_9CAEN
MFFLLCFWHSRSSATYPVLSFSRGFPPKSFPKTSFTKQLHTRCPSAMGDQPDQSTFTRHDGITHQTDPCGRRAKRSFPAAAPFLGNSTGKLQQASCSFSPFLENSLGKVEHNYRPVSGKRFGQTATYHLIRVSVSRKLFGQTGTHLPLQFLSRALFSNEFGNVHAHPGASKYIGDQIYTVSWHSGEQNCVGVIFNISRLLSSGNAEMKVLILSDTTSNVVVRLSGCLSAWRSRTSPDQSLWGPSSRTFLSYSCPPCPWTSLLRGYYAVFVQNGTKHRQPHLVF